jgi:hypothetical protein
MPPPRLGRKPYGALDSLLFRPEDPWGFNITEYEEAFELRPGLDKIAQQVLGALVHLGEGRAAHGIAKTKLQDNPYWPPELAEQAGKLPHERYVVLLPLALSRTQDDKGRLRWTVFGNSEQGPARAFWRGFFTTPRREQPAAQSLSFVRSLLHAAYGEAEEDLTDLRAAGFRILPLEDHPADPSSHEEPLPRWTEQYLWTKGQSVRAAKYLLTFRPFGRLPRPVQRAYLAGQLHLLPFPGSLVFWGVRQYRELEQILALASQIPLVHLLGRNESWRDIRVPQSGWLHEPRPGRTEIDPRHGPVRNTFKRTHRWAKVLRDEDELMLTPREDKLAHVLFSALPEDVGLYGKPMARNAQVWSAVFQSLLDGPRAKYADLKKAMDTLERGGMFGYRFLYPAMRVGRHELYWHRPLVAYLSPQTNQPAVLPGSPLGYLTAYDADRPDAAQPVELWPRLLQRPPHLEALQLFQRPLQRHPFQTTLNIRKLLDTHRLLGEGRLPRSLARRLLTIPKQASLENWLTLIPEYASDPERARSLADQLRGLLEPETAENGTSAHLPESLTFERTARRSFEVTYWRTIAALSEGQYLTKNNADCVRDPPTQKLLCHHRRDLDLLGNYLLNFYAQSVAAAGLTGRALVGDLPFQWQTDFHFSWMGGWLNNQEGAMHERNLCVVIPGRDRRRAVIMADHYDTAFMADKYEKEYGGTGARLAAAGADDNHSATASLMLAAPIFLDLSNAGKLGCDIWLIHLTGEEFPADCLGARHLTEALVEGTLKLRLPNGAFHDLSATRVQGVYVLDMVAHNNDHDRDVFQISPGTSPQSMWLAHQAHVANEIWNASTRSWNQRPSRRDCGRSQRSPRGAVVPEIAQHPYLYGEVRPPYDPRSTLYNTDGQIFSDAGVPVVLFMENYDINRTGYHDTHDTMENIDLDYGAAVAAIAIEAVARAATPKPEREETSDKAGVEDFRGARTEKLATPGRQRRIRS